MNTTAAGSTSTSGSSSVVAADTCAWVGGERCGAPRSCRACLNSAVASGNECAVGPRGECMVSQQLRQQLEQSKYGSQSKIYSASSVAYCSVEDAACQACTAQWLADFARGKFISSAAMCSGAGGCLCLATCELPTWEASVLAATCPDRAGSKSEKQGNDYDNFAQDATTNQMLIAAGSILALVTAFALISLWLGRLVRKIDDSRQERLRNRFRLPVRVPTGPQLQLEGWTSMRERLVQADSAGLALGQAPSLAPIAVALSAPVHASSASIDGESGEQPAASRLWVRW